MITVLLLGAFVSVGSIERGDEIVRAQLELLKLSYSCSDPLYRAKRDDALKTVSRLQGATTFKSQSVMDLDSGLKNKTVKMVPINKGDCIALLSEAQDELDRLYTPAGQ